MERTSTAVWHGNGLEGKGALSTQSGAFADQPYGFAARFQSAEAVGLIEIGRAHV